MCNRPPAFRAQQDEGKEYLILFVYLNLMMQPKKIKQIDVVISAVGLRPIVLSKAVSDAWERMKEGHYRNMIKRVLVGRLLLLPALLRLGINLVLRLWRGSSSRWQRR